MRQLVKISAIKKINLSIYLSILLIYVFMVLVYNNIGTIKFNLFFIFQVFDLEARKHQIQKFNSFWHICAYSSVWKHASEWGLSLPRANRLEKSVSARVKRSLLSQDIWFFVLSLKAPIIRLFSSRLLFFCRKPASLQHGEEWQNISSALILDARGKKLYLQPVALT